MRVSKKKDVTLSSPQVPSVMRLRVVDTGCVVHPKYIEALEREIGNNKLPQSELQELFMTALKESSTLNEDLVRQRDWDLMLYANLCGTYFQHNGNVLKFTNEQAAYAVLNLMNDGLGCACYAGEFRLGRYLHNRGYPGVAGPMEDISFPPFYYVMLDEMSIDRLTCKRIEAVHVIGNNLLEEMDCLETVELGEGDGDDEEENDEVKVKKCTCSSSENEFTYCFLHPAYDGKIVDKEIRQMKKRKLQE